jgi:hypothetical protein
MTEYLSHLRQPRRYPNAIVVHPIKEGKMISPLLPTSPDPHNPPGSGKYGSGFMANGKGERIPAGIVSSHWGKLKAIRE